MSGDRRGRLDSGTDARRDADAMAEGACDHEAGGDLGETAVDGGHSVGVAGGELW